MAQSQIDIAVIGAGPQALTLITHLLQKHKRMRERLSAGFSPGFQVFDPSGTWLTQWHRQFAAQEIRHLRSPAVHHPDCNPHNLRTFATGRGDELYDPYGRPGTELFRDFCETVIDRWHLRNQVTKAKVAGLTPQGRGFRLTLADGQAVIARRVVLATGAPTVKVPDWAEQVSGYPPERLCHAKAVSLPSLPSLAGETVLIVGGGLTSAHLAMGALKREARVLLMGRRTFREKIFDAAPGWLGPKFLKGFEAETDWDRRWQMIQQARNGGSFTPETLTRLRKFAREDRVFLYEQCQVTHAVWQEEHWQVQCDNPTVHDCFDHQSINRIWLATGTRLDITAHPLLQDVMEQHPVDVVHGLPILDQHLRWPGCELFLMGPWAALQVGPVARNLFGAKLAGDRIVPALTKSSLAFSRAR
ncbi:FAD/NAD(P)-binding protein [cf. Phormidesmis sp. LEGE 11477]|uniref:FAD/NAD(P)-binding protein n=1 Tax=cf. Phormidesmis sp. LEGE 11477 TaxID=1828680 RepID=UPI00187EE8F5|nr:FAD/NAD(P)-binding protein [cf. Phormidesmis sp. LEGE 11477]MBE9064159.1 SidA/IucD/PvdA family monooxygenase [cf. Phormidesmis sp. LEGE 11477]